MTNQKIAIVGAGTAGLSTAIALAQQGLSPVLFEKHSGPTNRGAGLLIQPAGVRAFQTLGVGEAFQAASTPISRLLGESHKRRRVVDVRYGNEPARAISRYALSSVLLEKAQTLGVTFRFDTGVSDVCSGNEGVELRWGANSEVFDALVIADGADSALRSQAGLEIASTPYAWGALWGLFDVADWRYAESLVQRYRGTRQMFGLMPTASQGRITTLSFFWSLKLTHLEAWYGTDIASFRKELSGLWPEASPVIEQLHSHTQLAVARYHHAWPRRLGVPRIYVAGDSAHSMSPSLGLGSTLAAQDALAIAGCHALGGAVEGPGQYSRMRLRRIQWYQGLSRMLTPCFQGEKGGALRDCIFGLGASIPPSRWLMRRSLIT
jgi:2-polyprenyl-6-methoxyphenol hydroxylase-like FAD-dependent oxidoreductase